MADDYSIRAKITGDASEFKVAMEGAAAAAQSNTARIKQALEEAKAESAALAKSVKGDQEILAAIGAPKAGTGSADFVPVLKAQLAETEGQLAATKNRIAELQAELRGVPAAATAAAEGIGLSEKQLALMATAAESAARQLLTLPAIQEEVASRVNASVTEMAAIRKRADAEAAESAKILGQVQVQLAEAAGSGDARAQATLAAATESHVRALNVQQEVQTRQAAVTAEAAAREELLARATAQSTTATQADAEANVEAAIAKEGSAVAALKLSDAQEATLSGAQKQAAAITTANDIIQRSQTSVAGLQAEVATQTGIAAERMETYVQRAAAEVQKANAAIKSSQLALGEAITSGNDAAIASMAALQDAAVNAAAVLDGFKAQLAGIESAQAAAAEAAAAQSAALDVVSEVTAEAAERGQNFAAIQQEIAAAVGKTSVELESIYVRAAAAARTATAALVSDSQKLGPAIQQGLPGADAALATLRVQMQQTRITADELAARVKLVEFAEAELTPATQAAALAQYELAIAEKGSAIAALEVEVAARKAAAAEDQVAGSSNIARVALAGMTGSSQGVIFALSRVLAAVPAVSTALQFAFPLITAVAFIDILGQMVEKASELGEAFEGFGKEEKKRLEESIKDAQDAFSAFFKLRQEIDRNKEVGLSGIPQLGVASETSQQQLLLLKGEMTNLTKESEKLKTALDATSPSALSLSQGVAQAIGDFQNRSLGRSGVPGTEGIEGTRPETEEQYTAVEKKRKENQAEQDKIVYAEQARIRSQIAAEYFRQYIAEEENALDVAKKLALSSVEDSKKFAEQQYIDKKIGYAQETAALLEAEEQRHNIELQYAALHENINKERAAKGEVSADYPATKQRQDIALEDAQNSRNVHDINIHNAREEQKTLKEINDKNLQDARDHANEVAETAPDGHGKRAKLADLQAQQEILRAIPAEEQPKHEKEQHYVGTEIPKVTAEAARETETEVKKSVNEQYEAWIESGERTARDVQQYWTEIRTQYTVTTEVAQANASIVEEANKRIAASARQVHAEERKVTEEIQKQAEAYQERELNTEKSDIQRKYITTPQTSLNPFALTPDQKEKQELGQVDLKTVQAKSASVAAQINIEEAAGRTETENYQKLLTKKIQLDNEYLAKKAALENEKLKAELQNYLQYYRQISNAFFSGLNEWIFGQKTFGAAMMDVWKNIVTSVIQDIEKIAAKWIEEHIIMAAITKILGVDDSATTASAKTIAANETMAQSYVGLAGVTEFAYALASTFGDIPASAALAAAAVAIGEGYASIAALDTGGYIPKEGIAMLHPGEVVVNHPVTSLLSNIAARGGVGSDVSGGGGEGGSQRAGDSYHYHDHTTVQAIDNQGMDRVLDRHGKKMMRHFQAEMRSGRANN